MTRNIEHIVMNMLIEQGHTVAESRELINKYGVPYLRVSTVMHPTAGLKLIVLLDWNEEVTD